MSTNTISFIAAVLLGWAGWGILVRSLMGWLLKIRLRQVGVMLAAAAVLVVGLLFVRVAAPIEATGLGLGDFTAASPEAQESILSTIWTGLMGRAWTSLFLDTVFLTAYTLLFVLAWNWVATGAVRLRGHGLVRLLSQTMFIVSLFAGTVDLTENIAIVFLFTGRGAESIHWIAAQAGQVKWLLPLFPLFTLPAAGLWLFTSSKAFRKKLETQEMKKSIARMKAANPTQLFLGPIIGGLNSDAGNGPQVKLWAKSKSEARLYAWIGRNPDLTDVEQPVGIAALKKENGFAAAIPIPGLPPGSVWHYALTLSPTPPGKRGRKFPLFSVFPESGKAVPFNFYFGSCFRPEFPQPQQPDVKIFQSIRAGIEKDSLRFGFMIGDQIYADSVGHNGMDKIPETVAEYRRVYAHSWLHQDLRDLMMNLPVYMTLDDHEVDDDWRWVDMKKQIVRNPLWVRFSRWLRRVTPGNISRERLAAALQVFYEHQLMHAPALMHYPQDMPSLLPTGDENDPGGACYTFSYGAAGFFVLDVRTRRIWRLFGEKRIMDERQWQALETWLKDDVHKVKFIVSSSGILMRYVYDFIYDRWGAYKEDRERFVNLIAENDVENVVVLSGDVHTANAVTAELEGTRGQRILLREFCASPFQQESGYLKNFGFDTRPFGRVRKITFHHKAVVEPNYGVVRVTYDNGAPGLRYEIRNQNGETLAVS